MNGVGTLLRSYLRWDRWMLVWWTLGLTVLYWSQAVSVQGLYATQAEFDRAAAAMEGNPALIAMAGPDRALNTVGGQVAWQATAFGAVLIGLMVMFLVGRHTRGDEEQGRDELLRASAVGRLSTTTATFLEAGLACLLVGACVALSLVAVPLAVADSVALGVGLALCGAAFTGVALLAAQVTSTTRTMYAVTGALIGAAYVLRAIGDVGPILLTWLSPIGWYQRMYAFSGLRWWPALLLVAATAVLGVAAYVVFTRRDHGAGLVAARPGPAHATSGLASPVGLAWRLQRGQVLGWAVGLLLMGLSYGSLGDGIGDIFGDSQAARDMMAQAGGDLVTAFYGTATAMLALMACGFSISSALRPRGEEEAGRVEALLATGLSRSRWLLGQVVVTVLGTALVVAAAGVGLGIGYGLTSGDADTAVDLAVGSLGYVAPVLVLAGLARLLHGLSPRVAPLAWLGLLLVAVVLLFGELLRLPGWFRDLSPFQHLALVPAEPFRPAPVLAVLGVALVLSVAGQVAFRVRDVR